MTRMLYDFLNTEVYLSMSLAAARRQDCLPCWVSVAGGGPGTGPFSVAFRPVPAGSSRALGSDQLAGGRLS